MLLIRQEGAEDVAAIRHVNEQAFGRSVEADLVDALRERGACTLSLVATQDSRIVGHILFTAASVESGSSSYAVVALGPLAVLPAYQARGIGTRLVHIGLAECRRDGHEAVIVLGHPDFYRRFGFNAARQYGIGCEYDVPEEAFMIAELREGALAGHTGTAGYQPEFNAV